MMRLIASDFISHYRPSFCDLRIFLKQKRQQEAEPGIFEEVLNRLGLRHEKEHLATLGTLTDLSSLSFEDRIKKTSEAIANKVPLLYQPVFRVQSLVAGVEAEIIGMPDFLILQDESYLIRDSKLSRRIDGDNHPEILLQVQLYGWLFERS